MSAEGPMKIFAGSATPKLAERIAQHLGVRLGAIHVGRFPNGEVRVEIEENVRGADVFVIQSTSHPVNENLVELLVILDALRRASARRITAVVPYYGYGRQDRKARGREPITAKLVANLLVTAGAMRVLTMDLHAPQIQGFFDIPLDHLMGAPIVSAYLQERDLTDHMVIAPDAGGGNRARELAERLKVPIGFLDKRRPEPGVAEIMNIIGRVRGKHCILIDDIIDTGGTIIQAAQALLEEGAASVMAACYHPVLSGQGAARLMASPLTEVVVTDTIPLPPDAGDKFTVLSVAPLFGEAIRRIHQGRSVSELF